MSISLKTASLTTAQRNAALAPPPRHRTNPSNPGNRGNQAAVNASQTVASQNLASTTSSGSLQGVGLLCSWGWSLCARLPFKVLTTTGSLALGVGVPLASWSWTLGTLPFKALSNSGQVASVGWNVFTVCLKTIKETGDFFCKGLDRVVPDCPLRPYLIGIAAYSTSSFLGYLAFGSVKDILCGLMKEAIEPGKASIYRLMKSSIEVMESSLSKFIKVSREPLSAGFEALTNFVYEYVNEVPVIGPTAGEAFIFGADTVSNWTSFGVGSIGNLTFSGAKAVSHLTSYGVTTVADLASQIELKKVPTLAFKLATDAANSTGNTVVTEVVSSVGDLVQVAANAVENPMGTALGVSWWGLNMFTKVVGYTASNWRTVASFASIMALPILTSAAIYYVTKPAIPRPVYLPYISNYSHTEIPGAIRKTLSSGLECLSLGLEYIPGINSISAYLTKAPKPPVELCISQYNQDQITQSIEGLKEGNPQHLLLIEPQGSEREKILQNILSQSECNYIPLAGSELSWLINLSVNSSTSSSTETSSSTDKKNAIHFTLLEEIKQLVKNSPLPTILHIQGFESLRSRATLNSYGGRGSEDKTDAHGNAYEEVISTLKQMMKDEKRLMIIGETTHPSKIDSDFKHAMRAIQIDLPDYDTRVKILRRAVKQELSTIPEKESCLNEAAIATIAKRTPGLNSGLLEQLISDLRWQRRREPNGILTEESVKKATNQAIASYYKQLEGKKPKLAKQFHPFNVPTLEGVDKEVKKPSPPPVFNQQLQTQIGDIVKWTKNIVTNGGDMQNLLLYGAAGTGKTMVAEKIAKESGFNYISINGGDLAQFIEEGTHLTALNELFAFIDDATEPTILFIDEMDVFAAKRNTLDQARREILNAFLARTGTPSNKLMIIGTTNCMDTMDSAVLSRMSNKLHIAHPEFASRLSILTNIIDEKMGDIPERKDSLNDEAIKLLTSRTDGMAGRTLRALVTKLQAKRDTTEDRKLTVDMIQDVTYAAVLEERAVNGKSSWWLKLWDFRYFTLPRIRRAISRTLSSYTPGFLTSKVT